MTKKDFIAVSSVINEAVRRLNSPEAALLGIPELMAVKGALRAVTENLADTFAEINPRFDYNKFYEACGINTEKYLDGFSVASN